MRPDYTIVPWDPDKSDQTGFITTSWLSSFKRSHWARKAADLSGDDGLVKRVGPWLSDAYSWGHAREINVLLEKPSCRVDLAVLTEDPTLFCGFLAGEHLEEMTVLHYCFVKPIYRGQGIASDLITRFRNEAPLVISHRTRDAGRWIDNHNPRYVPYPAFTRRLEPRRNSHGTQESHL